MIAGKWVAPALLFFAGAVFGRIFGVRPLVRGAMAAATMTGMIPEAKGEPSRPRAPSRRIVHRTARRRSAPKRSRAA